MEISLLSPIAAAFVGAFALASISDSLRQVWEMLA